MNRNSFLVVYSLGTLAVMFTGYPWSQINHILLNPTTATTALDAAFWIALIAPFALIIVARARGAAIARPQLFIFPLFALVISASAFLYGWLSRAIAGGEPSSSGFLPMSVAMSLGLVSAFAPLLIHVACCVVGAAGSSVKPAR